MNIKETVECPICSTKVKCKSTGAVFKGICPLCGYDFNFPDVVSICEANRKYEDLSCPEKEE